MPRKANVAMSKKQQEVMSFISLFAPKQTKMLFIDKVHEMTDRMNRRSNQIEFKACFNNAYRFASEFNGTYCLGYAASVIPIEHAWIKVGDRFYDPTWQKYATISDVYVLIAELNMEQVLDYTTRNGNCPPDLFALQRLGFFGKTR